jgi:hypothetical protein
MDLSLGCPPNSIRHPRANGARPVGSFTRGTRGSWGETALGVAPRPTVGLAERLPVVAAARPYADLPDPAPRPDTHDGRVIISGRFVVKSIIPGSPEPTGPTACGACWIAPCECGQW